MKRRRVGGAETCRRVLDETAAYWRDWVRYLGIPFEWQEQIIRAAIILNLNAFDDTGAIIAAVTTSVPEASDSGRKWDYRQSMREPASSPPSVPISGLPRPGLVGLALHIPWSRQYHVAMGLRLRLFLVLIVPLILVAGVYGVARVRQQATQLLEAERRAAAAVARAVQIAVENALSDRQVSDIRRLVSEMVGEHEQIDRIRIFNRSLVSIASGPPNPAELKGEDRLRRVLETGHAEAAFEGPQIFVYVLPLRGRKSEIQGALEIAFQSTVKARVGRVTQDILVAVSVLTLVLALLTALVLQRQVLHPLSRLAGSMGALGEGQPTPPLPVRRRDEFGAVAEAFNRMVGQLDVSHRQILENSEHMFDLEQQLRRAAALAIAGKLASSIAHEVGTPLNIISGRAEILLHSLPADDAGRAELQVIIDQIDRIAGIIRTLLETVRPQKPEVQAVALGPMVERMVPLLGHMARRGDVSIVTDVPHDLPQIAADPGQLQQVLMNLLVNAVEATPPGGRVGVAARACRSDGRPGVATTVTDSGSGIPREVVGRIFEPFFTTKPPGQGTGLGLAICRDIAQSHEGVLSVESREGEGAAFTLWLPSHEAPA